jgi:LPS-assembly protein
MPSSAAIRLRCRLDRAALLGSLAFVFCLGLATAPTPASGQAWVGIPARPAGSAGFQLSGAKPDPNAQMLVQANELNYDYRGERVTAVGAVQISYAGSTLEADRVTYNQQTKRLFAEGNVRLTEADGKIINADRLDLDDHFRDGFVDTLHVETVDKTRMAAARAERTEGGVTVFQSGVYTACEPCKDNPAAPPKWQVKAARIIHSEAEKTIYFEDSRIEFWGVPVAYLPYFWTPDPTVKKKTGFLHPRLISSTYLGTGIEAPFFWNLAPDYDVTFSPIVTTNGTVVGSVEWRQRLMNGAYMVRGIGAFQPDRTPFAGTAGDRDLRGAIESKGDFRLSQNWWYGWDATLLTDNAFAPQYKLTRQGTEAVSQGYVFGRGTNSYFDARTIGFYGFSPIDVQKQLPIIHPLVDYKYKFGFPVFGGELTYNVNLASLTRQQADFDPITQTAASTGICDTTDLAAVKNRSNCLLRGIAGTYTRLSAEAEWRRTIIDPIGQIWTPFARLRADVASVNYLSDPNMGNFIDTSATSPARLMPTVGLDYRYPFISAHSWGTQIIEPRAQVIIRPNEQQIGRFPNEDSQALVFDDANLFAINKFPGYDRVEGGGRANVGVQYTAQFNQGGYFNALFGQSYQLFGVNSYAVADMANAGLDSGLETRRSDYVARATLQPNKTYTFASRFRFDDATFETKRLELEGRVNFDRWTAALTYGRYDAQPINGLLLPREGVSPSASVRLTQNWSVSAAALYSIDSARLNTAQLGLSYIDECLALNLVFSSNYGYSGDIVPNRTVMLQLNLRTLGAVQTSQSLSNVTSISNTGQASWF